jgi:hypothetical protein
MEVKKVERLYKKVMEKVGECRETDGYLKGVSDETIKNEVDIMLKIVYHNNIDKFLYELENDTTCTIEEMEYNINLK